MIVFKFDVLQKLKENGYTSYKLINDKIFGSGTVQALREGKPISWGVLDKLCELLNCQPGDLIVKR